MNNMHPLFRHLIAIVVFLIVTVVFCKPALDSNLVLKQGDVTGWQGMSNQSYVYKELHGHVPLWTTSMFGGMPAYQIAIEGNYNPLYLIDRTLQLWLPKPLHFFFLACISFYILCVCMKIRLLPAITGAIGFAFASFSPIIVTAGHDTQMTALAYCPAVIGAVYLLFEKKYFTGFALSLLFIALQVHQGHQQISYYLYMILGAMFIAYLIRYIKQKDWSAILKSTGLLAIATVIGMAVSAITLLPVYDFAKESKRGGQLVLDTDATKDKISNGKTVGLTKDYAFMWSYGKKEMFSLMFPGVMGYGTHVADRDGDTYIFPKLDEHSHLAKFLMQKLNLPEEQASNIAMQQSMALYWGDQPFTNGPVYLGVVICFLFIIGMFILNNKHKWWILGVSVFAILLAFGKNLPGFNFFMFDYFPFYNKFRVPTMTLVIPQILFPVLAAMTIQKLHDVQLNDIIKPMKWALLTTTLIFIAALGVYATSDFSKENTERTLAFNAIIQEGENVMKKMDELNSKYRPSTDNQLYEGLYFNLVSNDPNADKTARQFVTALQEDRASLFLKDIISSLIYVSISILIIGLYLKRTINWVWMAVSVAILNAIDLVGFGAHYLNEYSFEDKSVYEENAFPLTDADRQILQDKDPNFRVFNTSGLDESKTSYYHKSIGGYHPAKLGIYDDLMQYQLSGRPNMQVINMLNTKYFIQQEGGNTKAIQNPDALGNVWFVDEVKWVNGPAEEMKALNDFDARKTAIIDNAYKNSIGTFNGWSSDSTATISQVNFDNDKIIYASNSQEPHVAVFSEIFYKDWKAYIDGKPAPYVKANYVLRAMTIPAGKHEISFVFEPTIYHLGNTISTISGWVVFLITLIWAALEAVRFKKQNSNIKSV